MKSKHIYNGEIPVDEIYSFINPISLSIPVERASYQTIFNNSEEVEAQVRKYFETVISMFLPSISEERKEVLIRYYCTFSYMPHSDGYDFRFDPRHFVNSIFNLLGVGKSIDFINFDKAENIEFFKEIARNNIHEYLLNKNIDDEGKIRILMELDKNLDAIVNMYKTPLNAFINKGVRPKDMLFYLAYKSLVRYESTRNEKYAIMPYEYYHNVCANFNRNNASNSAWPHRVWIGGKGKRWFDQFMDEYEALIGKDKVISDSGNRLDYNEILIGCEILKPGEFTSYAKETVQRQRATRETTIDYEKYEDLLNRKINCYSNSGFDTFIRGELGLDGYIGLKYRNEYILLDQLYKTDRYGVKNLLIEPEAFFAIPSDRLSLIRNPKTEIIKARKTDARIEKHNHTSSNSFENNVHRIITGPNVSLSTFDVEIEKLSSQMLIKRR